MAASAALRILQPVLLFIAFLAIAIWFVIVQVLQPLSKTARAVAKRSPSSLDPIPSTGLPYELRSLVNAINDLMRRLGDSLTAQQRFASDAAHELRTPLAAIKLQAQLLARAKTDEDRAKYAGRLQQGVARATKLVEQLLTIARLDPDASQNRWRRLTLPQWPKPLPKTLPHRPKPKASRSRQNGTRRSPRHARRAAAHDHQPHRQCHPLHARRRAH